MLTAEEKDLLLNSTPKLSRDLAENEEVDLLIKMLLSYIDKTDHGRQQIVYSSKENEQKCLEEILTYMVETAATVDEPGKFYTTGELSTYFGVSITTINNWVNEGKFIGVERKRQHEQLKVNGDVLWRTRNGDTYKVSEIVEEWEEDQKARGPNPYDIDEKAYLRSQIALYEEKYNGTYEETLRQKENRTAEEDTNAESWNYLLWKMKN